MGSTFGHLFRVTTFGESHGPAVGCVIDGCPPGIPLSVEEIQADLDRRRPGQSALTTARGEADRVEVLSGVFEGATLGTPIALLVRNQDARTADYEALKHLYRPSHADRTTEQRYGRRDWRGGGRASARETVGRVAAGAVARKVLEGIEIVAWVDRVADVRAQVTAPSRAEVDASPVRCPDPEASARMEARIREAKAQGDTVGGVVRAVARGVPAGLGDPVFDKLEADLARAMLSIPAAKGFESGSGFAGSRMRGSQHNDLLLPGGRTASNRAGGIVGGISNGMPIEVAVAFKPVATLLRAQPTVDDRDRPAEIRPKGRYDPCVLPRAVPIVEAMMALVLCDHLLRLRAIRPE